jgi:hypothetical protein
MKEFKDGEILKMGEGVRALQNISFSAATTATPTGEKMLVIIQMDLRSGKGLALETIRVSVPAAEFSKVADIFRQRADQLARNTTPTARPQ